MNLWMLPPQRPRRKFHQKMSVNKKERVVESPYVNKRYLTRSTYLLMQFLRFMPLQKSANNVTVKRKQPSENVVQSILSNLKKQFEFMRIIFIISKMHTESPRMRFSCFDTKTLSLKEFF